MSALSRFFAWNREVAQGLTPDHVHEANVFGAYRKVGAMVLSHPEVRCVVDCGAGKSWHFPAHYKDWYGIKLIGLDIDADEMACNGNIDEGLVCDATKDWPLAPGSVDLITVASGIEHFEDNQKFLENAFRALRPNGYLLAQFPGRYAPFSIANRLMPQRTKRRMLRATMGEDDAEQLGFTAYYDRTHASAFSRICRETGFEVIYHLPGYYSSSYFEFFLPAWCVSYAYDWLRFGLGIRDLASYNLFLLQKPHPDGDPQPFRLYAWK